MQGDDVDHDRYHASLTASTTRTRDGSAHDESDRVLGSTADDRFNLKQNEGGNENPLGIVPAIDLADKRHKS